MAEAREPDESAAWVRQARSILRQRRLVALSTAIGWLVVLSAAFAVPPRYRSVATVALPGVPEAAPTVELRARRVVGLQLSQADDGRGLPMPLYARLSALLSEPGPQQAARADGVEVRFAAWKGPFPAAAVAASPSPSPSRVAGVDLTVENVSATRAIDATTRTAEWIRGTAIMLVVADRVREEMRRTDAFASGADLERLDLEMRREELRQQEATLVRLERELGRGAGAPVIVGEGDDLGYRFLPPRAQTLGIRVLAAADERRWTSLGKSLEYATEYRHYLRDLGRALDTEIAAAPSATTSAPERLRAVVASVPHDRAGAAAGAAQSLCDDLAARAALLHGDGRGLFIEPPSVRHRSRTLLVATAMVVTVLLAIGAGLLRDGWIRSTPDADAV